MSNILNIILWFPIMGMILLLILPKNIEKIFSKINIIINILIFSLTILLYLGFDANLAMIQPSTQYKIAWIEAFNIYYHLGIDGISLPMILLTNLLFLICSVSSLSINKHIKSYFVLMFILQWSVIGVFLSLDFFLFYLFWEIMLIPMFFLIGIWGGENRQYAAIKFFLYTFLGSLFMLAGMIALYFVSGQNSDSFNLIALQGGKFVDLTITLFGNTYSFDSIIFWLMFISFAVKIPSVPLHTWLPHAHVEAPTTVSVILAGVLLKMGTYGLLRIAYPIFPGAAVEFSWIIAVIGVFSILYGAFCALAQKDAKRLIAYSSISHMGFVLLGISSMTTAALNGAILQMFSHGLSTALMFLLIGILYEKAHHRFIVKENGELGFGGLYEQLPKYTLIFSIGIFASMGLPGFAGFISEALIFLGSFQQFSGLTFVAILGLILGAGYFLWMFKRMFFGEPTSEVKKYTDLNAIELIYLTPICFLLVFLGLYPSPVLNLMKESVGQLASLLSKFN